MTALQCHSKLITELTIDIGFFSLILPKYFIGLGNIFQHIFVVSSKNICVDISARLYKTAPGEQYASEEDNSSDDWKPSSDKWPSGFVILQCHDFFQ